MKYPKSIIFFDGDGTLWYPKSTKRTKAPHWIYTDGQKPNDYLPLLMLTPSLVKILKSLKKKGITLVALSTHPHPKKEADLHMKNKIEHFKLDTLFDHIDTARPVSSSKGQVIESFLRKNKIPKSQALLVGDSYLYDYLSAKEVGVDSLLIKTSYMKHPTRGRKVRNTISDLKELLILPLS